MPRSPQARRQEAGGCSASKSSPSQVGPSLRAGLDSSREVTLVLNTMWAGEGGSPGAPGRGERQRGKHLGSPPAAVAFPPPAPCRNPRSPLAGWQEPQTRRGSGRRPRCRWPPRGPSPADGDVRAAGGREGGKGEVEGRHA